jgi:hypothetical protein
MFTYSYCYVCSVLGILFYCVVLCIVCVDMCTVQLPPGVNAIAVNKIYHIISFNVFLVPLESHAPLCLILSYYYRATYTAYLITYVIKYRI